MSLWVKIGAVLCLLLAVACSNSANDDSADNSLSEAQQLLQQFGELQVYFTEAAMQALLDCEDTGRLFVLYFGRSTSSNFLQPHFAAELFYHLLDTAS
jgi:hypothetical protein